MTTRDELVAHDFIAMSDVDLLDYCGADARKWAEAFCQIKKRQGWSSDDIDEGLMTCWFANAIEHSSDVRRLASRQEVSVTVEEMADDTADNLLQDIRSLISTGIDDCLTSAEIISNTLVAINSALAKYSSTKREG